MKAQWRTGMTDEPLTAELLAGAALASALMAANYPGDSGEDVDRLLAELGKRGYRLTATPVYDPPRDADGSELPTPGVNMPPYVGGHPEMPLHDYVSDGSGGCVNCLEAARPSDETGERLADRDQADPWHRCPLDVERLALAMQEDARRIALTVDDFPVGDLDDYRPEAQRLAAAYEALR